MVSTQYPQLDFLSPVQMLMERVELRMRTIAEEHLPDMNIALGHLLSAGGKRIRPAIALLTGCMLGADEDRLVTLAAAIELLHTATLVHDDLIDGALLRRGMTTLNARWSPAATVLTGDLVFARAAKFAAETDSVAVMRHFADTLGTIVNGELTQMFSGHGDTSRDNYEKRIYAKTASMFVLATVAAATLSPVDESVVEKAQQLGYGLGMAFQIVDDVLDFTGEQTTIGKPVGSDLRQGLFTLPAIYYIQANPDCPDIRSVLNGKIYNGVVMERLIESIRQSDAIQRSMQDAQEYVDKALIALDIMPNCVEKQSLQQIAKYITSREL